MVNFVLIFLTWDKKLAALNKSFANFCLYQQAPADGLPQQVQDGSRQVYIVAVGGSILILTFFKLANPKWWGVGTHLSETFKYLAFKRLDFPAFFSFAQGLFLCMSAVCMSPHPSNLFLQLLILFTSVCSAGDLSLPFNSLTSRENKSNQDP